MERTKVEINKYIQQVVREAKRTANVETGFLKRSIRGNYFKGIVTFRQVFYGAYNNNSKLIEIAQRIMPKDIDWRVIFVDEEGRETTVKGETRTGRKIQRKSISSLSIGTSKIKDFLKKLKANAAKKISEAEGDREFD